MFSAAQPRRVHVIGAGIVGCCSAWYLQRAGFDVTLIEKDEPGRGASSGNAGSIGLASVPPMGMPGMLRQVPGMLRNPLHPLNIRWNRLPAAIPWFVRFAYATGRARVEAIADARAALLVRSGEAFESLLSEIGHGELVEKTGLIHTFQSSAALARAAFAVEMRRKRGVRLQTLTGDELREIEPALSDGVAAGVWYPDVRTCVNPQRMTELIAGAFVASGGRIVKAVAKGFEMGPDGPHRIFTDGAAQSCDLVVLASGAWSGTLAAQLGCKVPLEAERGYHIMLKNHGSALRIPLVSADHHIAISPMEHGLRLSTGSEFSEIDAAPRHDQAMHILSHATDVVRELNMDVSSRWVGSRPATPDSLPVIGRSPRFSNVLFAFGHGHVGLTFGAISGRLVSQLARGAPTEIDVKAFRPDRSFTGVHLPRSPCA